MRQVLGLATILIFLAGLVPAAFANEVMDLEARVFQADGKALAAPSKAAPAAAVAQFLADSKGGATLETLEIGTSHSSKLGFTHLRMTQKVGGLDVFGTYVKAAFNDRGELVHLIENLAPVPADKAMTPATVTPRFAVEAALAEVHPGLRAKLKETAVDGVKASFAGGEFFHRAPTATRLAIPMADGSLEVGYLVEIWTQKHNLLHHVLVSGGGEVLGVQLRTNTDSYNIFPDQPLTTPQQVVNGPGAGNAESPNGWLFAGNQSTVDIAGNNVNAYLDTDANNASDGGGSTVSDGNFLTSANLGQEPETAGNQAVAVQNLFYFNNVIHDKLYRHGFVESVGNFQENNFGNGGSGGDSVNAEAQDGSGTNNANFSTPSDGSNPRMQMFVWTTTSPKRDGDVDSDIIWHEYGHGLTWRMIGSMSGPMSGAIGEGMSDVLSIYANDDDVVGEYSTDDPFGVRSAAYTNYGRTYGDFGGSSVHFDGEIYAATMWRLKQLWEGDGRSMDSLWDIVVGGMNFTPSGPAMEDMRDGILAAAATQAEDCLVWEAFAQFGIGEGAEARVRGGGPFGGSVTVTESFDVPLVCSGCTVTENPEVSCSDGQDNDCDGLTDSNDPDCGGGSCSPNGASCRDDVDCCSGNCSNGPPSSRVCQ